jgi:hypothetical protein
MLYQSHEVGFLLCNLKSIEVDGELCAIAIQLPSVCQEINTCKKKFSGLKNNSQRPNSVAQWINADWE